jgi:tetraacyldisaccharide 4'-kinase
MLFRLILLALAGIYYIAYKVHHRFCLRQGSPLGHARLIVVGSFLAGGAGKTPFVAWLAQFISANDAAGKDGNSSAAGKKGAAPRIAILCHDRAQDEAAMLRQKFADMPQVHVIATPNRYRSAHEIDRDYDFIICDDGFEDSRLAGAITIRLDRAGTPQRIADLVPAGRNRSLPRDHEEPAVTLGQGDIRFRIGRIANAGNEPCPAGPVAICGIGDPERFRQDLASYGIEPAGFIARPDHDRRFEQTIMKFLAQGASLVMTEKDFARLPEKWRLHPNVFVAYQEIEVSAPAAEAIRACCGLGT